MENLLSYIGSIASVGSIPLAFYFYLKNKEDKIDKIRRQILKIISYQIGESRLLNQFEIEKVINSNIRNNRLANNSIALENILEDLVSDTISSPLLNAPRKDEILDNLKSIFPDKTNVSPISYQATRWSTTFASAVLFMSVIPAILVLALGEKGWNAKIEWWLNFNIIEGYLPNLIFSLLMASFGLLVSFIMLKTKKRLILKQHITKASTGTKEAGPIK